MNRQVQNVATSKLLVDHPDTLFLLFFGVRLAPGPAKVGRNWAWGFPKAGTDLDDFQKVLVPWPGGSLCVELSTRYN